MARERRGSLPLNPLVRGRIKRGERNEEELARDEVRQLRKENRARRHNAQAAREHMYEESSTVQAGRNRYDDKAEDLEFRVNPDVDIDQSNESMAASYRESYIQERQDIQQQTSIMGLPHLSHTERLKADCARAGDEYMARLRAHDLFGYSKDRETRQREIENQHQGYARNFLLLVAQPMMYQQMGMRGVTQTVGSAVTLWMLSKDFREMTGTAIKDAMSAVPNPLKPIARWFDRTKPDRMPFTPESAAMTRIGVSESYYDRLRDIRFSGLDSKDESLAIKKITDEYELTMERLSQSMEKQGVSKKQVHKYEQMIIGVRSQKDPSFAAKFTEVSHGRLSRNVYELNDDKKDFKPWSGDYVDGITGKKISSVPFSIRMPMGVEEHQNAINIGVQSALKEHIDRKDNGKTLDCELMAAFASVSLDAQTTETLSRMYPDTGFGRFAPMMHAMAQDGIDPTESVTTAFNGIVGGMSLLVQREPEAAAKIRENLQSWHYDENGNVELSTYMQDMQRVGELYGLYIKKNCLRDGYDVMSPEEFIETYEVFRASAKPEQLAEYTDDTAKEILGFIEYDEQQQRDKLKLEHAAENAIKMESAFFPNNLPGGKKAFVEFVDKNAEKYHDLPAEINQCKKEIKEFMREHPGSERTWGEKRELSQLRKKRDRLQTTYKELKDELSTIVGKDNFSQFSTLVKARGLEIHSQVVADVRDGKSTCDEKTAQRHEKLMNASLKTLSNISKDMEYVGYDGYLTVNIYNLKKEDGITGKDIATADSKISYIDALKKYGITPTETARSFEKTQYELLGVSSGKREAFAQYENMPRDIAQRIEKYAQTYVESHYAHTPYRKNSGVSDQMWDGVPKRETVEQALLKGVPEEARKDVLGFALARGYDLIDHAAEENAQNPPLNPTAADHRRAAISRDAQKSMTSVGAHPSDMASFYDMVYLSRSKGMRSNMRLPDEKCLTAVNDMADAPTYYDMCKDLGLETTPRAAAADRVLKDAVYRRTREKVNRRYYTDKLFMAEEIAKSQTHKGKEAGLDNVAYVLAAPEAPETTQKDRTGPEL